MKKYLTKAYVVEAIQFKGSHESGLEIQKAFPDKEITLEYDYNNIRYGLKVFNSQDSRFYNIKQNDYVVKGALGEFFIYRENLFDSMFIVIPESEE